MSAAPQVPGQIGWVDLTVDDAPRLKAFYEAVTGWSAQGLSMGDYEDWVMSASDGTPQAGICHARGANSGIPAQWLVYITVANLDTSITHVVQQGGRVIQGPRNAGTSGRFVVIEDPAGATCALFEAAASIGATS